MANIVADKEILQFVTQLNQIKDDLAKAYLLFDSVEQELCENKSIYNGCAINEMTSYFNAQKAHLQKLIKFYQVGSQFVKEYHNQMNTTDNEISGAIANSFNNK